MSVLHKTKLVDQWIQKAENDLRNATIVVGEPDPPTDTVCFHCHQTVEKYLKAFLIAHRVSFKKVHDLRYLFNQCSLIDSSFADFADEVEILNGYYIETRYPLDFPIYYTVKEAQKAVDFAHEIKKFITRKFRL